MTKSKKIDLYDLDSLKDSAGIIFPDHVTAITIIGCPANPHIDIMEEFLFFDFETEGSYITYPKSKLKQYTDYPFFALVSLRTLYSLN